MPKKEVDLPMTPLSSIPALLLALCVLAAAPSAQAPAPSLEVHVPTPPAWIEQGEGLLRVEDPLSAWRVFRDAQASDRAALRAGLEEVSIQQRIEIIAFRHFMFSIL